MGELDVLLMYLDDGILHPALEDLDEVKRREAQLIQRNEELAQQVTQMAQQQVELKDFVQHQALRQDEQFRTLMNYIYEAFI